MDVARKKITEGSMNDQEMDGMNAAKEEADREKALRDAIKVANDVRRIEENTNGRFSAGSFMLNNLPPTGDDMLLPVGYAIDSTGVYHAEQDKGKYVANHLTKTAFFVAARDVSNGKVLLLRKIGDKWYREWLRAGQIKPSTLADLLILPADAEAKELVTYAIACAAEAPLIQVPGAVTEVAKIVLEELLPNDATFPYLLAVFFPRFVGHRDKTHN
jgi:hypothetical protein